MEPCSKSCIFSFINPRRMHMRSIYFLGVAAVVALISTDPAICAQISPPAPGDVTQSGPVEPSDPANPVPTPMPDPSQPNPPITEPLPPEMPVPASEAPGPQKPPVQGSTDAPVGPMSTPPDSPTQSAQNGDTTSALMQPTAATKDYPPCSKTLQDNCRNRGEGPKAGRKPR